MNTGKPFFRTDIKNAAKVKFHASFQYISFILWCIRGEKMEEWEMKDWKNQAWFRSAARYSQWRSGRYILYFKVDFLKDLQHNDRIPEEAFLECSVALVTEKSVFGKVQKATYIKIHLIIGWSEVNWTIKKSKRNLPGGLTNRNMTQFKFSVTVSPIGCITFASGVYGGTSPYQFICNDRRFHDLLELDDKVMADRDMKIKDDLFLLLR